MYLMYVLLAPPPPGPYISSRYALWLVILMKRQFWNKCVQTDHEDYKVNDTPYMYACS